MLRDLSPSWRLLKDQTVRSVHWCRMRSESAAVLQLALYLACLKVTEKSTADRPDYDEEDDLDEFDEDDLDWEVDSTSADSWRDGCRLLSGWSPSAFPRCRKDITTAPQDIACFSGGGP